MNNNCIQSQNNMLTSQICQTLQSTDLTTVYLNSVMGFLLNYKKKKMIFTNAEIQTVLFLCKSTISCHMNESLLPFNTQEQVLHMHLVEKNLLIYSLEFLCRKLNSPNNPSHVESTFFCFFSFCLFLSFFCLSFFLSFCLAVCFLQMASLF